MIFILISVACKCYAVIGLIVAEITRVLLTRNFGMIYGLAAVHCTCVGTWQQGPVRLAHYGCCRC